MSLKLAKYQQMFDVVKNDIAVKEMVKMMFIEKQIEIAKAKKKQQFTNLWDDLPYDCQEIILSHKQDMEWGYLYEVFGKYPMTTITRWLSANHVKINMKAEHTIPLLWSMINRKDLNHAVADYKLSNGLWHNLQGQKMKERLIADGVENIGFQHKVYKDISLDSLKDYRREELAINKAKRDAKRKAEEKKPQETLPIGTLIAYRECQAYDSSYRFLIIRGETKTQYRVEKISNQTKQEENIGNIGYGGFRNTTRCPKVGQTYEKHRNISKKLTKYELEDLTRYEDKGDYYEKVYQRVWEG